ncbi:unnamed protein product [Gulo gulo]|uniref:Uncharacterized protein n=1 Tax=Gulo gulo TaxID=48420 RepID=A0A9X9MCN9_GULGU|nr:unnamed protein product [Gulo gulo]
MQGRSQLQELSRQITREKKGSCNPHSKCLPLSIQTLVQSEDPGKLICLKHLPLRKIISRTSKTV